MKRILSTALLLTLSVSLFTSPVFAKETDQQEDLGNVSFVQQEMEWDTLEGTIKEIREVNLIVEDSEGKEYTVPILGFKDLKEYQAADVQIGQKISISGRDLSKLEPGKLVRITLNDSSLNSNEGDVKLSIVKNRISALEAKEQPGVRVIQIDENQLREIEGKGGKIVFKASKEGIDGDKVRELGNIKVSGREQQGRLGEVFTTDEEGTEIMAVKAKEMSVGGDVFLPQEITINNITIHLPRVMVEGVAETTTLE